MLRARRVGALLVLLMSLAGCGASPETDETLRRGLSSAPASLDPQQARSVPELKVIGDLYEGLLSVDARGDLVAGVARSWSSSPAQTVFTFELRADARWEDGEPVTAHDFVAAWRHLADPATTGFYANLLAPIGGARAVLAGDSPPETLAVVALDDTRLEVRLDRPQADFLHRLAHPALAPRRRDRPPPFGNGAYRLDARSSGRLTLVRSEHYHARADVQIARVSYEAFEQEATEYAAFLAGELDVTSRVPREVFLASGERNAALHAAPYLGTVYLAFNMREPPPLPLRRALSMTIDREALARTVLGRGETPALGLVPPEVANGDSMYRPAPAATLALPLPDRIAMARELVGESPRTVRLAYASSDENRVVATALQGMWRDALPGVRVELQNREFRVLLSEMREGRFEGLIRASWIADFNDVAQFLSIFTSAHPANNPGFADTRYDALIDAAGYTDSARQRAATLRAAEALLAEQVPVIPLYHMVSKHLVAPRVRGWQDNVLDLHYSRYLALSTDQVEP